MTIDRPLIFELEKLARLQLTDDERAKLATDLTQILGMVDKLKELPTDGIEPLRYLTTDPMPPREDLVKNQLSPTTALKNAPETDGEFFIVPKVI